MGTYYRALILADLPLKAAGHFGADAEFFLGKWHSDGKPFAGDLEDRAVAECVLEDLDAHGYQRRALLTVKDALIAVDGASITDSAGWIALVAALGALSLIDPPAPPVLVLIAADQ